MRALVAPIATAIVLALAAPAGAQLGGRLGSPGGRLSNTPQRPRGRPSTEPVPAPPLSVAAPPPRFRAEGSGAPPDLVLTRDGGMIRGTIVRSEPGRIVEVQLVTGDVQRIAWSDVRYAGRAEEAPVERPAPSQGAGEGRRARAGVPVRFEANARLTLHIVGGTALSSASAGFTTVHGRSDFYERGCTAPCVLDLAPGVYHFGLSIGVQGPVRAGVLDITGPGTLYGRHVDNAGLRAAGWLIFLLGLAGGGVAIPLALMEGSLPLLITGGISGGLGLLVGIPLMAAGSGVTLRFE